MCVYVSIFGEIVCCTAVCVRRFVSDAFSFCSVVLADSTDSQTRQCDAEAKIVFPLVVAATFAKDVEKWKEDIKDCVCWIDDLNDDDDDEKVK